MPYAKINGLKMHYEVYGAGDPVLLVNGLGAPAVGFLYQVRDLSPTYRVITADNRGVGETDAPDGAVYPTAQLAEDARALLDQLDVPRAHVLGTSMGGTIAMELAVRHPKRVRSLALCCTWADGDARFLAAIESWRALARQLSLADRFRHLLFPWIYSPAFLADPKLVEDALARALAYPYPTKAETYERQGAGILEWNGSRLAELKKLRIPALVLAGRDDILTPPAFSRRLAGLIPKAQLRIIPGGHGFFLEEAPRFNRAVLQFLATVKR